MTLKTKEEVNKHFEDNVFIFCNKREEEKRKMKDEWTKEYLEYEKETILDQISDELEAMSMNDFSNLVEQYDLGIEEIDQIFWSLREKLYEERKNKNEK